ncbi:MAG: ROK family protein, partial [Acidobacteria bacterium]|nr:ROK family protein [Acidobacteriota bacterium]
VQIADKLQVNESVKVIVENDSTAAAMYEARVRIRRTDEGLMSNFILVRSGTGIGVGLVIGGDVFRGSGSGLWIAGEFGHMTIVAGGKPCVCGNRGCWEKYASAASAASLYLGDRPPGRGESVPRFVEIVSKAENGDNRSRRTLEKIGDYLGIGIANVIMGIGVPRVIISGRLVYGWKYIKEPMYEAIGRSIVGKFEGWSVEAGEPMGSAIGGALEVAVDEFLTTL